MKKAGAFPCIICEYPKELDDFKQAVARAYRQHGYRPGECVVICVPRNSRSAKMARGARPINLKAEIER